MTAKARRGAALIGQAALEAIAEMHADCVLLSREGKLAVQVNIAPTGGVRPVIVAEHLAPRLVLPERALWQIEADEKTA